MNIYMEYPYLEEVLGLSTDITVHFYPYLGKVLSSSDDAILTWLNDYVEAYDTIEEFLDDMPLIDLAALISWGDKI